MTAAKTSTDLVPVQQYAIATRAADLATIMRENVGNGGMTPFDLDRVKVPTSGGKMWTLATLEGDEDVRTFDGVIVDWREPRAFWEGAYAGGGTPPDCSSTDGLVGLGMYGVGSELHPDGACTTCPMAQFGSAVNDKGDPTNGQACKAMRLLFVLRPEALLPVAIFCPPTSIKPLKQFFMRLSSQGVPYYGVVTRFGLEMDKNGAGVEYSKVTAQVVGRLTDEERSTVHSYASGLRATLDRTTITADDLGGDDS